MSSKKGPNEEIKSKKTRYRYLLIKKGNYKRVHREWEKVSKEERQRKRSKKTLGREIGFEEVERKREEEMKKREGVEKCL